MKKLVFFISISLILFQCIDDSKIRIPDVPGGVNLRMIIDPIHTGIFTDKISTDYLAFDIFSENKDLQSVEIYVTKAGEKKLVKTFTQQDFDQGNGQLRVEMKATDFATIFGEPGLADGTKVGNFTFTPLVKLTDGRVYPDYIKVSASDSFLNIGPSINGAPTASFTLAFNSFITCPAVDISGDYEVIDATGMSTDGCCPNLTTIKGNIITVTRVTLSSFTLSDFSGGLYFKWYEVYGITKPEDSPGEISFSCNEVNIQNTLEPFGEKVNGTGVYNPAQKTISYEWINGYGDNAKVILKKN
ncbi:MAG: hypothetical protein ABI844_04845 [Saprospiraceae bacterium]